VHLRVLKGPQNKHALFTYTALTNWFYNPNRVFAARYELNVTYNSG